MDALSIVRRFFSDVEAVRDAAKKIEIEVTRADVKASATKSHKGCAMAVACKRKMHLDGVIMSRSTAYLIKDKLAIRYRVPANTAREVVAFDRGGVFEPGTYALSRPNVALGVRGGPTKNRKPHKRMEGLRHVTANIRTALV